MEQTPNTPRLSTRTPRWSVVAVVVAALLVFTGAAFAQTTQPQTDTSTATVAQPDSGLVVIHVVADSPAATAGVARGDIILAVDGDAVNTLAELAHVVMSHKVGDVIVLKVMHGDEERSLSVTLDDNNGTPALGVMAVGDMAVERRMEQRGPEGWNMPGRGGRQGQMPAMPFGHGQMPEMPRMPFGHGNGQGMQWNTTEGALVVDVMADGAAATAGIQAGDVITAVNDAAVASSDELVSLLGDHKPGDVITVTYDRDGTTTSAEVTLGANPGDATKAYMGIQIAPVAPVRMQMGEGMMPGMPGQWMMPEEGMMSGVVVADVTADGPAATAGLKAGDWITAVNGVAIDTPQALVDAVQAAKAGDEMVLTVISVDSTETIDVTVTLGKNADGGALLGVQIGGAMRMQRGPGGMNFDFHGEQNGNGRQNGGGRFQAPNGQNGQPVQPVKPDARFSPQPGFAGESA